LRLEVRKVIRASRERVFEAWTKPEVLAKWFGPADMVSEEVSVDLRVGGAHRIAMKRCAPGREGAPDVAVATGVYREIVPPEKVSFSWKGNWNPGEETLVTVLLKDVADGTEVTLVHERFGSTESMSGHEHGWVGSMAKLAALLER
jgi:uncharacterized protein YndB with AHSA1/START domain